MDYLLAKELKDAGFPQKQTVKFFIQSDDGNYGFDFAQTYDHALAKEWIEEHPNFIVFPTISELIEACGDKFDGILIRRDKNPYYWIAADTELNTEIGSTPEEAVAHLWLELSKNPAKTNLIDTTKE